jgi:hypothetical protein
MHARSRSPAQRRLIEARIDKTRKDRASLRAAALIVDVSIARFEGHELVRVTVDFDQKQARIILRGGNEWSRVWLETSPGVDAVLAEMTKRLEGRKMTSGATTGAQHFTPPAAPARPSIIAWGVKAAVAASMRHTLDRPVHGAETPSSVAFYLQGAFSRAFPALRFEVTPA